MTTYRNAEIMKNWKHQFKAKPFLNRTRSNEYFQLVIAIVPITLTAVVLWENSGFWGLAFTGVAVVWFGWHVWNLIRISKYYLTKLRLNNRTLFVEAAVFDKGLFTADDNLDNISIKISLDNKRFATFLLEITIGNTKLVQKQDDDWTEERLWRVFFSLNNLNPKKAEMLTGHFDSSKYDR